PATQASSASQGGGRWGSLAAAVPGAGGRGGGAGGIGALLRKRGARGPRRRRAVNVGGGIGYDGRARSVERRCCAVATPTPWRGVHIGPVHAGADHRRR